jgi:hypothetical protein
VNNVEEFTTLKQRKKQVEIPVVLEAPHETKDEVVVNAAHDLFLSNHSLDLISIDELALVDSLQSIRRFAAFS